MSQTSDHRKIVPAIRTSLQDIDMNGDLVSRISSHPMTLPGFPSRHEVQFYQDDRFLQQAVAEYVRTGIEAGEAVIVIATTAHLAGIEQLLDRACIDLGRARSEGAYVALDAVRLLPTMMSGDMPDGEKFSNILDSLIDEASEHQRPVRMFGELVALLALDANYAAAIELERLWNQIQERRDFSLFCAYSMESLAADTSGDFLTGILDQHTHVVPAEGYSTLQTDLDRSREIIALQQKAAWLEAEVAARKALEVQLQDALIAEREARAEAEATLALRDEFLSIAAHELRTPITVLSGHAQLIQRQIERNIQLDPQRFSGAIDTMIQQTGGLSKLIDQLMDVSRLESGKLAVDKQRVDTAGLIESVVQSVKVSAPDRDIVLTSHGPCYAIADPLRIEQIVINLIDNAVRHAPACMSVEVDVSPRDGGWIDVTVRDYGPGIAKQHHGQIFDRFYQADGSDRAGGLGLGLYLARQIVTFHDGTIEARCPEGGGTCFTVSLPSAQPASGAERAADD